MPFLKDDEFIVLMNANRYVPVQWGEESRPVYVLSLDDRKRFRDAGIQTALEFVQWNIVEPEQGRYDFSMIKEILLLNREAGMKTIFSVPSVAHPDWMSDKWMIQNKDGVVMRKMLSPWNTEAQEYLHDYISLLVKTFATDDVMFIFGAIESGEAFLPCEPHFYDPDAVEDYKLYCGLDILPTIESDSTKAWLQKRAVKYFLNSQHAICSTSGRHEIWNMQQWLFNEWSSATVNYAQPAIMQMYKNMWPDGHIVLLQYTYYDSSHNQANEIHVDMLREKFGCDVIVEAHFCRGLKETTPKAIAKGFRGQVLCAAHPMVGQFSVEDWMFDEVKKSHKLWLDSRQ